MASLYEKWDLVQADLKKEYSILLTGAAMQEAISVGATAKVGDLYDPMCTGFACPAGSDPLAPPPEQTAGLESSSDTSSLIIIGVTIGAAALVVTGAILYFCRRTGKSDKIADAKPRAAEEANTSGTKTVESNGVNVEVSAHRYRYDSDEHCLLPIVSHK